MRRKPISLPILRKELRADDEMQSALILTGGVGAALSAWLAYRKEGQGAKIAALIVLTAVLGLVRRLLPPRRR